jgi:acyl-CoA synthetase (AMP-forming)/AMP-acid ligase II
MNDLPADVGALAEHWRRAAPDREALRYGERSWTWAQLADQVGRNAAAQLAAGLRPGDRVALLDKTSPAHLVTALACMRTGTVMVPVNFRLTAQEARQLINDARARLLLTGTEFGHVTDAIKADLPSVAKTVVVGGSDDQYDQWLAGAGSAALPARPAADACFLQVYTSGTTGYPKGAMLTGAGMTAQAVSRGAGLGASPDNVWMAALPTFHTGVAGWVLAALYHGACVVLVRDIDPPAVLEEMTGRQVTHVLLVPALLGAFLKVPGVANRDYSHVQALVYTGSSIPPALLRRCLETFPVPFVQAYGMTEASLISVLGDREHRDASNPHRLASAGKPLPGVEVAIADPGSGERLGRGQVGEVRVRSRHVMLGYWTSAGLDTSAITSDGWLRTGDTGYLDDDGYLYLTGRLKDMYITGSSNVYAAEVERVLAGHPGVAEAAVIGVPDDTLGEVGLAFLIPAARTGLDESEVLRHCREHLAAYKCPASLVMVGELPRNALGKVVKDKLREQTTATEPTR